MNDNAIVTGNHSARASVVTSFTASTAFHVAETGEVVTVADLRRFYDGDEPGLTVTDWDAAIQHGIDHDTLHALTDCTGACRYSEPVASVGFHVGPNGAPCRRCETSTDSERLCEKHALLLACDNGVNPDLDDLPAWCYQARVPAGGCGSRHFVVFDLGKPVCFRCRIPMPGHEPGDVVRVT